MIVTRSDAFRSQQTHYFTGKPCAHGHTAKRYVSTGNCVECLAARGSTKRTPPKARRPGVVVIKNLIVPREYVSAIHAVVKIYMHAAGLAPTVETPDLGLTIEQARAARPDPTL